MNATNALSIQINPVAAAGNPVPFLNQPLVPTAVPPGSPGLTLSVTGTGFVSGATIDWNGKPLTTTFVDGEHLSAAVPALSVLNPGTATVTVVNPAPGGGSSNGVYFQVGAPVASVNFVNATNSPLAAPESVAVVTADFNGDGKPDLAVIANVRVYVWLGNGDGTFAATAASPLPVPSPPYDDFPSPYAGPALVVGDFNHSGHAGLAVGLFQNEAASILLGNGDGTFDYSGTLANTVGQATMALTAADFNGDGNLDLAAIESLTGSSPTILLGYSSGAFNNTGQFLQFYGVSSAAGDLNGDGKLDLVIDGTNILLGNGDGTFTPGVTLSAGGFVVVGDFNGDGKLDLAVADNLGNNVTILLGDGTGNFAIANGSPIPVGNQPQAIITADFNNDGKLDLAVANSGDGTVTLLLGNGDGTFTASAPIAVGTNPTGIAAADFNGDGKLDLAVATNGGVAIFLQQ